MVVFNQTPITDKEQKLYANYFFTQLFWPLGLPGAWALYQNYTPALFDSEMMKWAAFFSDGETVVPEIQEIQHKYNQISALTEVSTPVMCGGLLIVHRILHIGYAQILVPIHMPT